METCVVGMDIGFGRGARIGAFDTRLNLIQEVFLPIDRYGGSTPAMTESLSTSVRAMMATPALESFNLCAIGMAASGLFASDGTFLVTANLPFLKDTNLPQCLSQEMGIPVNISNDADAGAIAEWIRCRREILYWAFGIGWGGAWVTADGQVRFPSVDWDGRDESLHYTSEPGYAIALPRSTIDGILRDAGASLDLFEKTFVEKLGLSPALLRGPAGRLESIRAEVFVSGHGQWRILHTLLAADPSFCSSLQPSERAALDTPASAGPYLDELAVREEPVALRTLEVFGQCLAEAADILFQQARRDGCAADIPIYLAGKPTHSLPFFGPTAYRILQSRGIQSTMQPSAFDMGTGTPNMAGAAALAIRILD